MPSAWSRSALLRLSATGVELFALAGSTFGETSANAAPDGAGCVVPVVVGTTEVGVERDSGAIHLFPIAGVPGADPGGRAPVGALGTTTPACGVWFDSICAVEPRAEEPEAGWPVGAEVFGGRVVVTGGVVVGDVVGAAVVGVGAPLVGAGATVVAVVGVAVGELVVVRDGLVSDGLGFFLTWLVGGLSGSAETREGAAPRIRNSNMTTRIKDAGL